MCVFLLALILALVLILILPLTRISVLLFLELVLLLIFTLRGQLRSPPFRELRLFCTALTKIYHVNETADLFITLISFDL